MFRILVVEDDRDLNNAVCTYLRQNGFEVEGCLNATDAYNAMYDNVHDLIISDIMMPGDNGFEFAKNVRAQNTDIPILFMSARDDMPAKQQGFNLGVDDYMTKPLNLDELVLRINALLRRAKIAANKKITIGKLVLNADERSVMYDGEEISLTAREFNIVYKMLSFPKKTFSRTQLMDEFWGVESTSGTRTVDVYMTKIRDKFSNCNEFEIVTVHGLGYKAVIKNDAGQN